MLFFWIFYPFIMMSASHFIVKRWSLLQRYQLRTSDIATPLLFIGLHYLSDEIFSISITPYMFMIVCIIGIVIAVMHAYFYGDIHYKFYFKMFWRFTFLISLLVYSFLIVYGLIRLINGF
ncbi:DUF3397 domain-containing protein [Vagococcus xieshaowenii]